jgi:hypothetical protein
MKTKISWIVPAPTTLPTTPRRERLRRWLWMAIAGDQLLWIVLFLVGSIADVNPVMARSPLYNAAMPCLVTSAFFALPLLACLGCWLDRKAAYAVLRFFLFLMILSIVVPSTQ